MQKSDGSSLQIRGDTIIKQFLLSETYVAGTEKSDFNEAVL